MSPVSTEARHSASPCCHPRCSNWSRIGSGTAMTRLLMPLCHHVDPHPTGVSTAVALLVPTGRSAASTNGPSPPEWVLNPGEGIPARRGPAGLVSLTFSLYPCSEKHTQARQGSWQPTTGSPGTALHSPQGDPTP